MKENVLYEVIVREMKNVRMGENSPERAALNVIKEFANDRVYVSSRFVEHVQLGAKVIKLKNYGVENSDIADRLGISERHVRRLWTSAQN